MAMPPDGNDVKLAYLKWLRRHFQTIDHIATLSEDHVTPLQPALLDVFVPQRVRAEPPPVSLPRELWLRYLAHGKITEHDVPHDVRRDLLDHKLKEYAERPARPVLDVLTRPEGRLVVLLGYAGAGKSMLARYIALSLADLAVLACQSGPGASAHPLAPLSKYIPFVVELRTYPKRADCASFVEMIGALADPGCPPSISVTRILESCLRERGNALVIFDGLDEVFDLKMRDQLKEQIKEFAQFYTGARVIVTSRVTDYDRHELDQARFAHHTLQDLDPLEVSDFAHRFYHALYPANEPEAERLTARLLGTVRRSPAIAELAGNPLLLTSIAFLGRAEEVPPTRIDALGRTVRLLAEGWDAGRHLRQRNGSGQVDLVDLDEKLQLLRLAARRIIDNANGQQPRNYLSGNELKKVFSGFVAQRFKRSQGDADAVARHLLDQLRDRDYILAKFETDAYGFVHRAFLDYLAADDIRHQFAEQEINEDDVVARFRDHWREPAWQEVLPLLAGLLRAKRADLAIRTLLRASPLWYLDFDPLPRHVLLAIRCLGEVRHYGETEEASKAIGAALCRLFETIRERSDYGIGVTVAHALERAAVPVLATLPPDWDGRPIYETWYLARGQFLKGERPGPAQIAAARVYATLLGRDGAARKRLTMLARWAGSEALQAAAIEALAAAWPDGETAELLQTTATADGDLDGYVRQGAVRALARHWPDSPATRDLLCGRALGDRASEVRGTAVRALADAWHDADIAALLRGIGSGNGDWSVRVVAVRALADAWHDDPDTLPWLWQRAADGESPRVRAVASEVLVAGWHDNPDTLPWLRKHATDADESHPQVRVAAVRALASGWPDRADTAEFLTATACPGGDILEVRRAALEALAAGWRDKKRDEQVARVLRERATADPDDEMRYVAAQALAVYWADARQTVSVLERLAFGGPDDDGTNHHGANADSASDADPYVRAAAAQALAIIRRGDLGTGVQLRNLASRDDTWYVRQMALRAVAAGWHDDPATPCWLKERAALDGDADVRGTAVQVFAEGWHDAPETLPWLRAPMAGDVSAADARSGDVKSAQACRVATREVALGWPDQAYSWLCQRACNDQHPDARKTALQLLAGIPEWHDAPETVTLLRDRAVCDLDPEVRLTAIQVISAAWHDDPEIGAWLRDRAFPDNESAAKLAVIRALATDWHDDPRTRAWLRDYAASDPEPKVQKAATSAVDRGWPATAN
jgi:hypothetical protein